MLESDRKLYDAICAVDPECRCPDCSWDDHDMTGCYRDNVGNHVSIRLAEAAIRDTLHTRLCYPSKVKDGAMLPCRVMTLSGKEWAVEIKVICESSRAEELGWTQETPEQPSKLRALLVAHAIRLGIDYRPIINEK